MSKGLVLSLFSICCVITSGRLTDTLPEILKEGDRISNGSVAQYGEFPYIVSIAENGAHFCGGFIYSDRFIVTSASCVDRKPVSVLKVYAGQLSLISPDDDEQDITVASVIVFEGYNNQSLLHDIALVQTTRAIVFSSNVGYISYSEVNDALSYATFAGWGATQDGGVPSTKLRKINMMLPADCSSYGVFENSYMICANSGGETGGPCQYDQGSPLVQENVLIGVMSNSLGCNEPYSASVFTRVSAYYPWLTKYAGEQPAMRKQYLAKPHV